MEAVNHIRSGRFIHSKRALSALWTLWRREISLPVPRIEPRLPGCTARVATSADD
jgi:hypothetical protein